LPVLRRRPAGRTRGCLLRSTPETSRRLRSQIRESPDSPGRFNVRGRRIATTATLNDGDHIRIGDHELTFEVIPHESGR
ncbi:hypothetical protein ACNJMN_20850, partial [Mycobacterium tuberculosis]